MGRWQPLSPDEAAALFASVRVPWWIAGGWALDLFLGVQTRDHDDIDVRIVRRDQSSIRAALHDWDVQGALPPPRPAHWPFKEWQRDENLDVAVHDAWCRPHAHAPWALQLMIDESDGDDWVFRRDLRIRRTQRTVGRWTETGIPYLAPEVQLLYKATHPRSKDEDDFARVAPYLEDEGRRWLRDALALTYPGHHWTAALAGLEVARRTSTSPVLAD